MAKEVKICIICKRERRSGTRYCAKCRKELGIKTKPTTEEENYDHVGTSKMAKNFNNNKYWK